MAPGLIALLLGGLAAIFGSLGSGGSSGSAAMGGDDGGTDGGGAGGAVPDPGDATVPSGWVDDDPDWSPVAFAPSSPAGTDEAPAWIGPRPEEQMIVELINRARMNPLAEVARLDDDLASGVSSAPVAPLAITPELTIASREHSQDMDDRDFFAHTNPDGQSPGARALEEGHGSGVVGENIGWIGSSWTPTDTQPRAEAHHANLWASDGHQRNLMNDRWSEIGVGYDEGDYRGLDGSSFVTEMFSDRGFTYLTGVVIEDGDGDDFYDIGEGLGGVSIVARDGTTTYATETWSAGGYALALPGGTYEVRFEGGGLDAPILRTVVIGTDNVKLDVIEDSGVVTSSLMEPPPAQEASAELAWLPPVPLADVPEDAEDEPEAMDLLLA